MHLIFMLQNLKVDDGLTAIKADEMEGEKVCVWVRVCMRWEGGVGRNLHVTVKKSLLHPCLVYYFTIQMLRKAVVK